MYSWKTFSEIEKIGKGGYGTVFRAKRQMGEIQKWNHKKKAWHRVIAVALKTIGHSELLSKDFGIEVNYREISLCTFMNIVKEFYLDIS